MIDLEAISRGPTGPDWHHSFEKAQLDAYMAAAFRPFMLIIAYEASRLPDHAPFFQDRMGLNGIFRMLKLQTYSGQNVPAHHEVVSPFAQFLRNMAIDEFPQIAHVSTNPCKPGPMSFIGLRPQTREEERDMETVMTLAGHADEFYEDQCIRRSIRPGIFGNASLLCDVYDSSTLDYYRERSRRNKQYYYGGSFAVDLSIFASLALAGQKRLQEFSRVNLVRE